MVPEKEARSGVNPDSPVKALTEAVPEASSFDPSAAVGKLYSAWQRERRFIHGRGLCHVAVWSVGIIVFALLLDWLLVLPGLARILLLGICGSVLGWVIYRRWGRHLRRYDPLRTALQVEDLYPRLESLLVSHVQLREGRHGLEWASPRLIEALHARALASTAPLDFGGIVDFRRLRGVAAAALGALLVLGASVVWASDFYTVFLARMLNPTSRLSYPTKTRIVSTTGDLEVQQGVAVTLAATVAGEIPETGTLLVRMEGSGWEEIEVRPEGGAPTGQSVDFPYTFERPYRDFQYAFTIGDTGSETYRVSVIPPPRIVRSEVRQTPPAYTGLPPRQVDGLNFEALEGSGLEWTIQCDRALSAAEWIREGAGTGPDEDPEGSSAATVRTIPLRIDSKDPTIAYLEGKATRSLEYRFRWRDLEHGFVWAGSVQYSLRVTRDLAPRVEILEPRHDQVGTLQKEIGITFRAVDDYGLEDAWIIYSVNDGPEQKKQVSTPGPLEPSRPVQTRWRPLDDLPALAEGDSLIFAIEVSDRRDSRETAGRGRSRWRRLQILSVADYLKYLSEKKSELFSNIQGVLREETDGAESIEQLKELTR